MGRYLGFECGEAVSGTRFEWSADAYSATLKTPCDGVSVILCVTYDFSLRERGWQLKE